MKHIFTTLILTMSALVGCSHFQDTKRIPADVGVIGPNDEVLLYYKNGRHIVIKECSPIFIQGKTPFEARKDCEGKSKIVPVENFKRELRKMVSTSRMKILKPLTSKEVKAYKEDGPNTIMVEKMVEELEKINDFIEEHGEVDEASLVRKEALVKALRSQKTLHSAIKKINKQIEKAVSLIVDNTKLTSVEYNSSKNNFLYTTLKNFEPSQHSSCGLRGSVDERIEDCSYRIQSRKEGFVLVTAKRDLNDAGEELATFVEVYKELSTGLLWSPSIMTQSHYNAPFECKEGIYAGAEIPGLKWRLPTISEYEEAEKSGIRNALLGMDNYYWTSSKGSEPDSAWMYNGHFGRREIAHQFNSHFVRCVAEVEE